MRRNSIAAGAAVLAMTLAASRDGQAQAWLSDRASPEGRGVSLGDFELHAGAGLEFGYDSNTLATATNPIPALRLRASAYAALATRGPQRLGTTQGIQTSPTIRFRGTFALWYNAFIGLPGQPSPTGATGNDFNGFGGLGGTLDLHLDLFPGRAWQFLVYEQISRVTQGSQADAMASTSLFVYDRIQNSAGFGLGWAPNGGILDVRLTYDNVFSYYTNTSFSYFSSDANVIGLHSRWRFFPKTALLWEATVAPTFYLNSAMSMTGLFTSFPITTRFGLNGLLTEHLGLLLLVGYTGTYFDRGDNASTPVAQAEIRYIFSPLTSFRFGLIRDVNPSYLGNYYIRNAAYLGVNNTFFGRLYVSLEASAGYLQYGFITNTAGTATYAGAPGFDGNGRWSAIRLQGLLFAEFRATSFFGINATLSASSNITDANARIGLTNQSLAWTKFEAFLGLRLSY